MDKETKEFLENMQKGINEFKNEMREFRQETNNRFDGMEGRLEKLEAGHEEIKALIKELKQKDTNRYLELKEAIDELRKDLTNVEIITSSNWNQIAKWKRVK